MKLRLVLKLSALLMFAAPCAAAQAQGNPTLAGVVVNSAGAAAPGAMVTADGAGLKLQRRADDGGRFAFQTLPVGTYVVRARGTGGAAYATVDLSSEGAFVTMRLLRTVAATRSTPATRARGSGTDVALNQTAITQSPAYGSLPDLLLQLPGAARGANGVVHINGDHGDINYIVDGVSIPQALNREVGTEIDPSDIAFMDVLEGAYPAQYGGRFAAVVNIDTKSSRAVAGVNGYVTAGSFASYDSDIDYHSPAGAGSIDVASREERSARVLDPPNFQAMHDNGSDANQFIRYAVPFGNDVLLASAMHSYQTFQIPNDVDGGQPGNTDDNETQDDTFLNSQYHHVLRGNGTVAYSLSFKRSRIRDFNDSANDFVESSYSLRSDRTATDVIAAVDGGLPAGARHAVKYGATFDVTNVRKLYDISLAPAIATAATSSVVDNAPNVAHTETAYVQDSWKMSPIWRVDFGVRADAFQIFSTQFARGFSQISPRLKVTRLYGSRADAYVYVGRFFTSFSFENVSPVVAQELNAAIQPTVAQFDLLPQRDTDIELGGSMPAGQGQIGMRIMQKNAVDLIDDTQVGVTALHQDINYARGNISSQSLDYQRPLAHAGREYISLTHTRSVNKGCETQLLAPCFGAPRDWTPADHDQRWDAVGGISTADRSGGFWSMDGEYGSGLSSSYCQPASDECKVPPHVTFDVERGISVSSSLTITLGVYNVLNDRYRITYLNAQGNHYAEGRSFRLGLRF